MSLHDGLNALLQWAARVLAVFTVARVRRRRLAARAAAAAESLVRVGDVAMPFKDIVAAGLAACRVPQHRIHAEVGHCIQQAIDAAHSSTPTVWLRNRTIIAEVTRASMQWREAADEPMRFRRVGFARNSRRNRRSRPS